MKTSDLISTHAHRPIPLRTSGFVGHQAWEHLLFAHWEVEKSTVQKLLPKGLVADCRLQSPDTTWLGIVPFFMGGIRPRYLPTFGRLSRFFELNLRAYVRCNDVPGVYFFSLDADSHVGVFLARRLFSLNYAYAHMKFQADAQSQCVVSSKRPQGPLAPASFVASYRPTGPVFESEVGSLEYFLTERYCVFSSDTSQKLWRSDIHHLPWKLQPAALEIQENTLCESVGLPTLQKAPHLLYARHTPVVLWGPQRIRRQPEGL